MSFRPPLSQRERVLNDQELGRVLQMALQCRTQFEAIVALLIITGQRRGEIAALQWHWINFGEQIITLPKEITKNTRPHRFPFGSMTAQILSEIPEQIGKPYVFPASRTRFKDRPATTFNGWGKPKADFEKQLGIPPWTLHDLRRTFRTKWAELGILREVAERYINHVSGVHSGIQAVYDRHTYLPEMRKAVDIWETHLQILLADTTRRMRRAE